MLSVKFHWFMFVQISLKTNEMVTEVDCYTFLSNEFYWSSLVTISLFFSEILTNINQLNFTDKQWNGHWSWSIHIFIEWVSLIKYSNYFIVFQWNFTDLCSSKFHWKPMKWSLKLIVIHFCRMSFTDQV